MGAGEIIAICAAVYLVGAYVMAFACGYFDNLSSDSAILWPIYLAGYAILGALIPFILIAGWLYNAGLTLSGRRP